MKYIEKGGEPQQFSDWKALANEDWQPTYGTVPGNIKVEIYKALLNEQGQICCYCERELVEGDYHIEHLNPQSAEGGDQLTFGNMLCSCLNRTAKGDPLHCGRLRGNATIDVHPLQENCSVEFAFAASGEMSGLSDAASATIQTLGLNIKKLIDLRSDAVAPFLDETIGEEDFLRFVKGYLRPSASGKLNAFHSMIKYIFAQHA